MTLKLNDINKVYNMIQYYRYKICKFGRYVYIFWCKTINYEKRQNLEECFRKVFY